MRDRQLLTDRRLFALEQCLSCGPYCGAPTPTPVPLWIWYFWSKGVDHIKVRRVASKAILKVDYTKGGDRAISVWRPHSRRLADSQLHVRAEDESIMQTSAKQAVAGSRRPRPIGSPDVRVRRAVVPSLDGGGPIWQQIRRALVGPILGGEWPPGTRIPGELELARRFGASRMTVCKAIQSLATEGLVQRRRKSGTVVAERALERPVFEIWDIADLITRAGGSYAFRLLECCELKQDTERRELLGVSSRTPTLWLRCLHLSDDQPFQLEERLVNIDAAPGITCHPLETESPGRWLMARVPWTDAEHKIFAREATVEVAAELKVRARTACLVVERRTWNGSMPVTYARLWHPGASHNLIGHFQPAR